MRLTGDATSTGVTDGAGHYSFTRLANGSYMVTPSLDGYVFKPANSQVTVYGANATGQSFASAKPGRYRGCLNLHNAGLPDGTYSIDPDGDGSAVSVYCAASSPYVAPVGLCQAESGAPPACRSYLGARTWAQQNSGSGLCLWP